MVSLTGRFAVFKALIVLTLVAGVSSTADAQTIAIQSTRSQIGFTGGLSIDPEQGFVGVFWRSPDIGGRFHVRPGIEGGFGNDLSVATVNFDFIMRFPIGMSGWDFVQGGGPAVVIIKYDTSGGGSATDVTAGGSYIIGFTHDSGFLGEFRIGGGNVPNLKLVAGFALGF
jgi:hypothetical protein